MTKIKPIRTGMELREARLALGWDAYTFAVAMGLEGERRNLQLQVSRWEKEHRGQPPLRVCLLTEAHLNHGRTSLSPAD